MSDLYKIFKQCNGVSIDTRTLAQGNMFFCFQGERFNGNKFAEQALEKGAEFVVVDDPDYYSHPQKMILVDDSLKELQKLASWHREQFKIPVLGITGTNGKTTTKELIAAVLSVKYKVLFTQGNLNNHIGVPLTLLQLKEHHEIAVIEMGANHVGEIAELCEMVKPNYGVLTNIGHAHLEGFGSIENVLLTKKAIYTSVAQQEGRVFVNADDPMLMEESELLNRTTYGTDSNSDHQVELKIHSFELELLWMDLLIRTHLFGKYNLSNAAAAIAIGSYFNLNKSEIQLALESYRPNNNRSQIVKGKHNEIIMDAYNANPDSMKAAIGFFNELDFERKALVLGDMLEMGAFEEKEHLKILDSITRQGFKQVLLVGRAFCQWQGRFPAFSFFVKSEDCLEYLKNESFVDYKILLKGSRGIRLEILKEALL